MRVRRPRSGTTEFVVNVARGFGWAFWVTTALVCCVGSCYLCERTIGGLQAAPSAVRFVGAGATAAMCAVAAAASVGHEVVRVTRGQRVELERVVAGCVARRQSFERDNIDRVFINEGLTTCEARTYLALRIKGTERAVVAFEACRPRLAGLIAVRRAIRSDVLGL